ncbi:MAG: SDR family NAD(P)-dependent oxidoreductase, partial [Hamadaea sp.]|uniref:type I polyketide synthase n=1 Tax=Hamadaea sp. TaxID=2024425 RepID=UPI0017FA7AD5
ADAQRIEVDGVYDRLRDEGYGYGPAFQGLTAMWQRDDEVFAEVVLPEEFRRDLDGFGLHPALFDAAMHAGILHDDGHRQGRTVLPFVWSGVALHATGASTLRVRIAPSEPGGVSLLLADDTGEPVLTVDSLVSRPVSIDQLSTQDARNEALFQIDWLPSRTVAAQQWTPWAEVPTSGPVHGIIAYQTEMPEGPLPAAAHEAVHRTMDVLRTWLTDERFAESQLVVITTNAVACAPDHDGDVTQAPLWGVVRAAQAENPGRIRLIDVDGRAESAALLPELIASTEPELAVRAGRPLVPRLAPAKPVERTPALNPAGTVLITGGTGGLGAEIARHLVAEYGVRHLLLAGRRGGDAPGAEQLRTELSDAGAEVTIAACDVGDRVALVDLLQTIPAAHPLTGVVHAAGVADNGLIQTLSRNSVDSVLAAKSDSAWYLHELTADAELGLFVLFSSAGGLVSAAGQAGYAAANVFLDALATHRRKSGLPAISLAWGLWTDAGMGQWLGEADRLRLKRQGTPGFPVRDGLQMFDAAVRSEAVNLVPIRIDTTALRARTDEVPALLRALLPRVRRKVAGAEAETGSLRRDLAGLDQRGQEELLRSVILRHAAALLGYDGPDDLDPGRDFLESGFDSLTAMELRAALSGLLGLRLPPMVVFDSKSPDGLVARLREELTGADQPDRSGGTRTALGEVFREAVSTGNFVDAISVMREVAVQRPRFTAAADLDPPLSAVTLASGPGTRLILLSTPAATGGTHQYARIAAHLRGIRDVSAVPLPGYVAGESLPGSFEAAMEVLSRCVLQTAGGEPFVLAGYSAGGVLAHTVAHHLESRAGVLPVGVALLDTYRVRGSDWGIPLDVLGASLLDVESSLGGFDDSPWSAMVAWGELLPDPTTQQLNAPVLFVQCGTPFFEADPEDESWRAKPWAPVHTMRTVAAHHFSLIAEDSAETARVVEDWLGEIA